MVGLAFIWRNNDCALRGLPENQCEPGPFNHARGKENWDCDAEF
jgi:hypothetical protein